MWDTKHNNKIKQAKLQETIDDLLVQNAFYKKKEEHEKGEEGLQDDKTMPQVLLLHMHMLTRRCLRYCSFVCRCHRAVCRCCHAEQAPVNSPRQLVYIVKCESQRWGSQ